MMQTIHRENADICYSVVGSGDVTLLFVHGSYMDQTYWKSQTDFFKDEYTVVTMDLPGHGQSGKERESWSVEGFAKDVTLLIDKLELKNVILIGHSLAGDINLIVAVALPERLLGFIGIETFKNAATALPEQYRQVSKEILKNLTDDFENTNEYYAKRALLTPQTPPEISQRIIKAYRHAYRPMGLQLTPQVFSFYESEQVLLPHLKFKLYLINVDYTPTNEAPLKQYLKQGYEVHHLLGTSHYPMIECPNELNKLLRLCIEEIIMEG